MISEVTAVSFRQNLGDMLNQVQVRHDSIVIKRDGKPVAALVDACLFERIRRLQARFDWSTGMGSRPISAIRYRGLPGGHRTAWLRPDWNSRSVSISVAVRQPLWRRSFLSRLAWATQRPPIWHSCSE